MARWFLLRLAGAALAMTACEPSGGRDSAAVRSSTPASDGATAAVVTPTAATLHPGGTVQLFASLHPAIVAQPANDFIWSTSDTRVAEVSATGLVRAVAPGSATITAHARGPRTPGARGTVPVTVLEDSLRGHILVGAGDIATCTGIGDDATASLLDGIPGTVFTLGDNAYPAGTSAEFSQCYGPTWGRHRARTRPTPGNHDYLTEGAAGYFGYFGAAAGHPSRGYYSYDLGDWHVIALNSSVSMRRGDPQERWLRADLALSTKRCQLAYWHIPRFSSGQSHGGSQVARVIWNALYEAGVEIVVNGHEHHYERFAPLSPTGRHDASRGVRQFIVGTGGKATTPIRRVRPTTSEAADDSTRGVLKFTLHRDGYVWEFLPAAGRTFRDKGSGTCH